ncbi:MAG: aa3-type cytochrome c oxidase subunit IV [Novosphingobium sp.]|nr:aa3-type cytochrome c oxidase subunit IV [Novosphingobium sp.]
MASGNDMKAAKESYAGFINMVKWGSVVTALVVLFVVLLIAGARG